MGKNRINMIGKRTVRLFLVSLLITICISCNSTKQANFHGGTQRNDAVKNAINDYSNDIGTTDGKTAYIVENERFFDYIESGHYGVMISLMTNEYTLLPTDTIGSSSTELFNSFLELDNKLFLWVSSEKQTNLETLKMMSNYKVLDSSLVKRGKTSSDFSAINSSNSTRFYIFCKNDIKKFKKLKAEYISRRNYPKLSCDK